MGEIIEGDNLERTGTELVAFDDAQLDLYLKLHKRVNAKNQETGKTYKNNILVRFDDIEELDCKITQSMTSLKAHPDSVSVRVIVAHNEGEADKFNSFEEFKSHNITSPNPTSEIALVYTFNCVEHAGNEVESYKIAVNLKSRIGELNEMEKEAPPFISEAIMSSIATPTARIRVEYSDYVKARHFVATFDEWIKSCDESNEAPYVNKLKSISHLIPKIGTPIIVALLGIYVSTSLDINPLDNSELLGFVALYASVFYILVQLSNIFLSKLERSIDSYIAISYLHINKGDGKLISQFKRRNTRSIMGAGFGLAGTILMGVLSSATYDIIKALMSSG